MSQDQQHEEDKFAKDTIKYLQAGRRHNKYDFDPPSKNPEKRTELHNYYRGKLTEFSDGPYFPYLNAMTGKRFRGLFGRS